MCARKNIKSTKKAPFCLFIRDVRRIYVSRREFLQIFLHACGSCTCVHARRRDSAVLSARSRPAADLGSLADRRRSGNVAGGIDSAPQPQPHVCRRAAMIPKPYWSCNGFSAVTRKPLPTTRHVVRATTSVADFDHFRIISINW